MLNLFTHLLPQESAIWARAVDVLTQGALSVQYDLHLGEGSPIDAAWPEWLVRQVQAVSRKRCDVVVEQADSVIIVEVKPRAGMGALGQCLCYRALYLAEYRPTKPVKMIVVCERVEPDVDLVYSQFGVLINVV